MSDPDPRFRMRWMAIALLLLTFLAGGLVGIAVDRVLVAEPTVRARATAESRGFGRPPGPQGAQPRARIFAPGGVMDERLGLSTEQQERIDSILVTDRREADAMLQQIGPRIQARYDSTTATILEVLTPEQRTVFERLRQEQRQQMRARMGPRGRRGPPPD
jgi:hypothetical protein